MHLLGLLWGGHLYNREKRGRRACAEVTVGQAKSKRRAWCELSIADGADLILKQPINRTNIRQNIAM